MIRKPVNQRLQRGQNQRIYSQMRRYFAPASLVPPPQSNPQQTGNRNTAVTTQNSANSQATDSAQLRFTNGVATWYYKTKFKTPPNVTISAIGDWPTGSGTIPAIYLKGPGSDVAIVALSTDTSDGRLVYFHAVGTPI